MGTPGKIYIQFRGRNLHRTTETPQEFINIINVLTSLSEHEVEICGTWLWVSGTPKTTKKCLKKIETLIRSQKTGLVLQAKKHHTTKRTITFDEIRDMFGSEKYNQSENNIPVLR